MVMSDLVLVYLSTLLYISDFQTFSILDSHGMLSGGGENNHALVLRFAIYIRISEVSSQTSLFFKDTHVIPVCSQVWQLVFYTILPYSLSSTYTDILYIFSRFSGIINNIHGLCPHFLAQGNPWNFLSDRSVFIMLLR